MNKIILILFTFILSGCIGLAHPEGSSMFPSVQNGDYLLQVYYPTNIKRGDIISFKNDKIIYLKRVIGLPGEIVSFRWKVVSVNGLAINEPYIAIRTEYENSFIVLGRDEYYVMGDNRADSTDSRSLGPINKKDIISKCLFRIWRY